MTPRARRIVALLVALDLVVVGAAVAVWQLRDGAERRGSKPPSGVTMPELTRSVENFPTRAELRGEALALAVTCVDCRSGDIFGGFLARLASEELPEGAALRVIGLGANTPAWRE